MTSLSGLCLVHVIRFDQILIKCEFVLFCIFECIMRFALRTADAYLWWYGIRFICVYILYILNRL